MDPNLIIPNFPQLPLPAPYPVLELLLILGFFLHVIPMNMMFGGAMLSAAFLLGGRGQNDAYASRVGRGLASALPIFISVAITQGIVPLLFVQLLYGPAYYTSSILIGVPWLSVLGLLLVAYYLTYAISYRLLQKEAAETSAKKMIQASAIMGVVALVFALIAFIFSNNMTLMLSPSKWVELYKHSASGFNLNLNDPQLFSRYLHVVLAALAVGGLTVGCFGVYFIRREPNYSSWLVRTGSKIFAGITAAQVPVGFWFLLSIPSSSRGGLMGHDPVGTVSLIVSMILTLVALVSTSISAFTGSLRTFICGAVAGALTILSMIVTRHMLRSYALDALVNARALPTHTQWDLVLIFVGSALALSAYIVWLTNLVWSAYNKPPSHPVTPKLPEGAML
jgi:hypothetical protein